MTGGSKAKEFDNMLTDLAFHQNFLNCLAFHGSIADILHLLDVFRDTTCASVGLISRLQLKQVMEDCSFSSNLIESVFSNVDLHDSFPYDGFLRQAIPAYGRVLEIQLVRGFEIIGGSSITLNVVCKILGPYVAEALRVNDILGTNDRMSFPIFLRYFDRHITNWYQTYASLPATHITHYGRDSKELDESSYDSRLGVLSHSTKYDDDESDREDSSQQDTNYMENSWSNDVSLSEYLSKEGDRRTVVPRIPSRSHTPDSIVRFLET